MIPLACCLNAIGRPALTGLALATLVGACTDTGSGPCLHAFDGPVLTIASVTDAESGEAIPQIRLRDIRVNGISTHPELLARRGEKAAQAARASLTWIAGELDRYAEGVHRLADLLARLPERCLWIGDTVGGHPVAAGEGVRPGSTGPCAGHVGVLGARVLAAGGGAPAADLVPRYLRRAEAEARRTGEALEGF